LQSNRDLKFHPIDNESLIAYSKSSEDGDQCILVIVNLDPDHAHSGWLSLELADLGVDGEASYQVHDLLSDARYLWRGARNYVSLDPANSPAHIFRIRRRVRSERDFDYFL
jgi:starch synthase (maltosyl-transferring)